MYSCTVNFYGGYSYLFEVIRDTYKICGYGFSYINIETYHEYHADGRCFYTEREDKRPMFLHTGNNIIPSKENKRISVYSGLALLFSMYKYHEIKADNDI